MPNPALSKLLDCTWIQIGQHGSAADFCREVRPGLFEYSLEHVRRHRNQRISGAHPVGAFIGNRHAERSCRNVHDKDPSSRMGKLLYVESQTKALNQPLLRALDAAKRSGADNDPRSIVSYAKNDPST